jgi:hypothetical protein
MAVGKMLKRRKEDMTPYRTCAAHPELLQLVTEVTTGLNYILPSLDEMKKTLNSLKDNQQTSMLEIKTALNDAKEFTREEANKIWPQIKTVEDRLEGAIQERNLKLTEVEAKLREKMAVSERDVQTELSKINKKMWWFGGICFGLSVFIAALEFLTRVGIIHWGVQ